MYTYVNFPIGGYKPDADLELLTSLDYAVGERGQRHTTIHVRGLVHINRESVPFAGAVLIADGRDHPTHDLHLYGHKIKNAARREIADGLAITIVMALDEYTDVTATEAKRLAGL